MSRWLWWLAVRTQQRQNREEALNEEANAAARSVLTDESYRRGAADGRLRRRSEEHPCPVCRALIDPEGLVQHLQWHDALTPLQRIGDP